MKILVIDDDLTQCLLLRRQLERVGHMVFTEQDPYKGLEILWREKIQFLITDWEMPGMNGLELVRQIRQTDLPYYIYIMMITGKQERDRVIQGLDTGADDYLIKPFDSREFIARVTAGERIVHLETRLRQTNEEMEKLLNLDYLTDLLNRRAVYAAARAELEHSKRTGQPIAVLFLDLDGFKQINDQYGHLVGDEILKAIASALQANLRPYDICGRWAGDEFIILLPGSNLQDVGNVAQRIRTVIGQIRLPVDGEQVHVDVSIGVHVVNAADKTCSLDLNEIIAQADEALYRAKNNGGAQVQFSKVEEATR